MMDSGTHLTATCYPLNWPSTTLPMLAPPPSWLLTYGVVLSRMYYMLLSVLSADPPNFFFYFIEIVPCTIYISFYWITFCLIYTAHSVPVPPLSSCLALTFPPVVPAPSPCLHVMCKSVFLKMYIFYSHKNMNGFAIPWKNQHKNLLGFYVNVSELLNCDEAQYLHVWCSFCRVSSSAHVQPRTPNYLSHSVLYYSFSFLRFSCTFLILTSCCKHIGCSVSLSIWTKWV